MADPYASAWAKIAADIAAEKRTATKPAQNAIVDRLVSEVVKARLARSGITDPAQVAAATKRITVSETGELVGMDEHGRPGVGTGPNYTLSLDDVVRELGVTEKPDSSSPGQGKPSEPNPFAAETRNLTAQMLMWKSDPDRAAHLEYLAAIRGK